MEARQQAQAVRHGRGRPVLVVTVGPDGGPVIEPAVGCEGPAVTVLALGDVVQSLTDLEAQRRFFRLSARALAPGGHLIVESRRLAASGGLHVEHADDRGVRILATDRDPRTGRPAVLGVTLDQDGLSVRRRGRLDTPPESLDRMAAWAGLVVEERGPTSHGHSQHGLASSLTVYRREGGDHST